MFLDSVCSLGAEARETIGGFADVFQMVKAKIPKREVGNFRLETLGRCYLSTTHDAHNAVGDAKTLKAVYEARLASVVNLTIYRFAY